LLPSAQVGSVHTATAQKPFWQSAPELQPEPGGHLPHAGPPQSTSVSEPFFTWSVQSGALHLPASHTPLVQSPLRRQFLPSAQPGHAPPQSTSVSEPLFTPSPHDDDWQTEFSQTLLAQSLAALQTRCGPQGAQSGPPQSMSLSAPFLV
jgi:hypothetical protein